MEGAMNWDEVEGNWKEFRERVQEVWGELTDADLDRIGGRREELEDILQERYGKTRDVVNEEVEAWIKSEPFSPVANHATDKDGP
jgi:uncharacterized protein YjbJ (UPF0337 family)